MASAANRMNPCVGSRPFLRIVDGGRTHRATGKSAVPSLRLLHSPARLQVVVVMGAGKSRDGLLAALRTEGICAAAFDDIGAAEAVLRKVSVDALLVEPGSGGELALNASRFMKAAGLDEVPIVVVRLGDPGLAVWLRQHGIHRCCATSVDDATFASTLRDVLGLS